MHNRARSPSASTDVFYVVESTGVLGRRIHRVKPPLYETRPQAERALAGLSLEHPTGSFRVWNTTTYVEPPEWLYETVPADPPIGAVPPLPGQTATARSRRES
jgi:hypothetical protein